LPAILTHLHEAALAGTADAELLRRFTGGAGADAEAAFAVLVRRHGPAVFRVCRAALHDRQDAEDALQAVFLVLATKARALAPRTALGPWLWEVARRVSAHARAAAARRQAHERRAAAPRAEAQNAEPSEPDLAAVVLDAVGRLPAKYRAPVVLCHLDGLSYQAAADRLGVSHATVRARLARGRERLRATLRRLGLGPAAAVALQGAAPPVSRALARATARTAVLVAAGAPGGAVSDSVLVLMTGGLKTMMFTKLKAAGMSLLTAGVLVAGAVGLSAQDPAPAPSLAPAAAAPLHDEAKLRTAEDLAAELAKYVQVRTGDPAERIARLALEAKRLQEAGDAEGALKVLRQMDDASWAWQGEVRRQRGGRAAAQAQPEYRAGSGVRGWRIERGQQSQPVQPAQPSQQSVTPPPAGNRSATNPPADIEARLRDVEQKLDRLLQALEGPKADPRPDPTQPRR
jgi:RNA polymerase sigma factor (sigma-70 family)